MTRISKCEACNRVLIHEEYEEDVVLDVNRKPHPFFVCKDCKEYNRFDDVLDEQIKKLKETNKL